MSVLTVEGIDSIEQAVVDPELYSETLKVTIPREKPDELIVTVGGNPGVTIVFNANTHMSEVQALISYLIHWVQLKGENPVEEEPPND